MQKATKVVWRDHCKGADIADGNQWVVRIAKHGKI